MTQSIYTLALPLPNSYFVYYFVTIIIIAIIIIQVVYINHKVIWIHKEAKNGKSLRILPPSDYFFINNVVHILSGLL